MWRAFFLAIGISVLLLGAEFLVIEQAVLHTSQPANASQPGLWSTNPDRRTVVRPPEWAPWILMSAGAVTALYALTLPRRNGN